jgi:hypothetical protein
MRDMKKHVEKIEQKENVIVVLLGQGDIMVGSKIKETAAAVHLGFPAFLALMPAEEVEGDPESGNMQGKTAIHLMRTLPAIISDVEAAYREIRVPKTRIIEYYPANQMIDGAWRRFKGQTLMTFAELEKARLALNVSPDELGQEDPIESEEESPVVDEQEEVNEEAAEATDVEIVEINTVEP